MRKQIAIYSGAAALWAMAVLGAIGLARWQELSARDTILLVLAVGLTAIVGTFIPAVQLGLERWRESQRNDALDEDPSSNRRE